MITHDRFLSLQKELLTVFPDAAKFLKPEIGKFDYNGPDLVFLARVDRGQVAVTWGWEDTDHIPPSHWAIDGDYEPCRSGGRFFKSTSKTKD